MEGPIHAARAADGRKFSLNRNALVPSDTSRPCSHPPAAYMVHFGELLTRQVTPDVTWTSDWKATREDPAPSKRPANGTRDVVRGVPHSLGFNSGDGRTAGGRDLRKM